MSFIGLKCNEISLHFKPMKQRDLVVVNNENEISYFKPLRLIFMNYSV
jgi:hypothetical protein